MDTKSKAERFLNMMTGDESMLAQDGIEVAQAYLDQCQEVERLREVLQKIADNDNFFMRGDKTVCDLAREALKDKQ